MPPIPDEFVSADLDEITDWYGRRGNVLSPATSSSGQPPQVHLEARRAGPVRVARSQLSGELTLTAAGADVYALMTVRYGAVHVSEPSRQWDLSADVAGLYRPTNTWRRSRVTGPAQLSYLVIAARDLERQLEELVDRPVAGPVDFHPRLPLRGRPGWLRLAQVYGDLFADDTSALRRPMVAAPLAEAVITALLYAADHPYRDLLHRTATAKPRHVQVVVDAIRAEPEHPYTVAWLARIAGVSVRSLQEGFRRHVGMAPMAYLRRVRLARVHDDLRSGDARTVSEVAHRWGFNHLGRFAADYAARYGVTPSATRSTSR